jgi:hypothetical protein
MTNGKHFFIMSRSVLLRTINISDKTFRKNRNTFLCAIRGNMGKYCRAGRTTDINMSHPHCMQDTKSYKHTLRTYNTYCFFPLQWWLHEHVSMLRYTYIVCLVYLFPPPHVRTNFPFILHPLFSLERLPPVHLILTRDLSFLAVFVASDIWHTDLNSFISSFLLYTFHFRSLVALS